VARLAPTPAIAATAPTLRHAAAGERCCRDRALLIFSCGRTQGHRGKHAAFFPWRSAPPIATWGR
jgi:hypothetical protein